MTEDKRKKSNILMILFYNGLCQFTSLDTGSKNSLQTALKKLKPHQRTAILIYLGYGGKRRLIASSHSC